MPKQHFTLDVAVQIVGELLCFSPLFIVAYIFHFALSCVISMTSFFIFKRLFRHDIEHLSTRYCVSLTYVVFIIICILYNGIRTTFIFMDNQPMIVIIVTLVVSLVFSYVGEKQYIIKENEKRIEQLEAKMKKYHADVFEEDILREYFVLLKTKPIYQDYLVQVLCHGVRDVVWFEQAQGHLQKFGKYIDEQQYRNYKYKFLKKIKEML